MSNNVICNAAEVSHAYHKMELYAEYLTSLMEQYIRILSAVQKDAICDDLISARLSALAEEVRPLIALTEQIIGSETGRISGLEISEIRAADNFSYPHEQLARVSSILAGFLG